MFGSLLTIINALLFCPCPSTHRSKLVKIFNDQPLPNSMKILPPTTQIRGMHTFIRDKDMSRDEFIFYSKRLMRLLIEYAISYLPFKVSLTSY